MHDLYNLIAECNFFLGANFILAILKAWQAQYDAD